MVTNQDIGDEQEITADVIEGIYVAHQHKIESIPGYADATKRVHDLLGICFERELNEQEEIRLHQAMAELYIIEFFDALARGPESVRQSDDRFRQWSGLTATSIS